MLTIYLFLVFLFAYAWILTPSRKAHVSQTNGFKAYLESKEKYSEVYERLALAEADSDAVVPVADPTPLPKRPAMPKAIALTPTLTITPEELEDIAPTAPNFASMTCAQLRKECSARGIKWRVRKGKGKGNYRYLSNEEMIQALS